TGRLAAVRLSVAGALRPAFAVPVPELERFERDWARSDDGRRQHWLRKEALGHLEAVGRIATLSAQTGLPDAEVRAIAAATLERRRAQLARHRRGRKRAPVTAHHLRWQRRFGEIEAELEAAYARERELGLEPDGRPTRWQILAAVAERDWAEHP